MNRYIANNIKFYQKKQYIKIRGLFVLKKYEDVVVAATDYLKEYPDDVNMRFMRAKSYKYLEMFDEAIMDLKYNIKNNPADNSYSYKELFYVYYYTKKYNEVLDLYPILYENKYFDEAALEICDLIIKKELGMPINFEEGKKTDRLKKQILNYNKEVAINHITKHLNTSLIHDGCYFNDINLNYLFDCVSEKLKYAKRENVEDVLDVYHFGISNIGYSDNTKCDYIRVIVIPNTFNIVSMYPVSSVSSNNIKNLDCDYEQLFIRHSKTKKISQIDKFNKKYGYNN